LLNRYDIINHAAAFLKAKDYLEIGCAYNECFDKIKVPCKTGVDPYSGGTIRMTSDDFFKVNLQKFDIVFIDGAHEHQQVWRDFCNAAKFLRPRGFIFLHDMLPWGEAGAVWPLPDKETLKDPDRPRCGTSWRAIFDIVKLKREFFIIDRETGIGVWRDREDYSHAAMNFDSTTITYQEFQEQRKHLKILDSTEGLKLMLSKLPTHPAKNRRKTKAFSHPLGLHRGETQHVLN